MDKIRVSLCTPTYDRREYIKKCREYILDQDYDKTFKSIEWIIIDDGTDKIDDLVNDLEFVKYYSYEKKMTLGKKRNISYQKSSGDIIFNIDDDDFYPSDKISYTVNEMMKEENLKYMVSGSSIMYNYFRNLDCIYKFGPYSDNHVCDGSIAFRKELLDYTQYDETKNIALESTFLKNYTFDTLQLDPLKTIFVLSHNNNTFDRNILLDINDRKIKKGKSNKYIKKLDNDLTKYIKNKKIIKFFKNQI
jgi:glycosyltransferase involved in cell wall biosynthesis